MRKSMIEEDDITKKQAKKLLRLIKRWTRCEIIARHGRFNNMETGQYAVRELEYRDKIRKYVFGTANFVEIGINIGILKRRGDGKTKIRRKNGKIRG
jgi:hypothetical protein